MSGGSMVLVILGLVALICVASVVRLGVKSARRSRELYGSIAIDLAARKDSRDIDELLASLREGWVMHAFPNRQEPEVLAYTQQRGRYVDVVVLRSVDQAAVFRVPESVGDVLDPDVTVWSWVGRADMALREMFALQGREPAPTTPQPVQPGCGIPADERSRMTWRRLGDGRECP